MDLGLLMLTRTCPLMVLPQRTSPLVVQHMWSTSYVPPRTQHLSTVSTKHTNLPRSYPHRRVVEYEPPSPLIPSHVIHHPWTYPDFSLRRVPLAWARDFVAQNMVSSPGWDPKIQPIHICDNC